MQIFTKEDINKNFNYKEFIEFLQDFYCQEMTTPLRSHHHVNEENGGVMLLMPSWSSEEYMGVKVVNVFPENKDVPSINGVYLLMSRQTGEVLGQFDGLALTCKRTAAVSALAGKLLIKERKKKMLMIGTGNLSGELIKAHHAVHEFNNIGIWGRDLEKAKLKALALKKEGYPVSHVIGKDTYANGADLISVATLAKEPVLKGAELRDDVYVDLVGSYQKFSREADDEVMKGAKMYVDTFAALEESGELLIPIEDGAISREDVLGDIVGLSRMMSEGVDVSGKVVFKSVGFAGSDLGAACFLMR